MLARWTHTGLAFWLEMTGEELTAWAKRASKINRS